MITTVFVYGTLQHAQCRGRMWPRQPLAIQVAYVRGQLFDLGPYPAIRCDVADADGDWIAGEVWSFTAEDIPATLAELDRIEECNQSGRVNLYDRCLVRTHPLPDSRESGLALAYQYSVAAALPPERRVCRGPRPYVAWPTASDHRALP